MSVDNGQKKSFCLSNCTVDWHCQLLAIGASWGSQGVFNHSNHDKCILLVEAREKEKENVYAVIIRRV